MGVLKRYIVPIFVWILVLCYIVCAAGISRKRIAGYSIKSLNIEIADSTADNNLVTDKLVREWLSHGNIGTIGTRIEDADLTGIERCIESNGFVKSATAYTSTNGVLYIKVTQRKPSARIMTDGYDVYVTADGRAFHAPEESKVYLPIVTGGYTPPFPTGFDGQVRSYTDTLISGSNGYMAEVNRLDIKYAEKRKEYKAINSERRASNRRKVKKRFLESEDKFQVRKANLDKEKALKNEIANREMRGKRYEMKLIDTLRSEQLALIKKEEKKYEDFLKLINFVEQIEQNSFWRSEIVQIIADSTGESGALTLELIPRSGDFTILFGEIENTDAKMAKLLRFYNEGLKHIGWDYYSTIDISCDGQVICRKS